jgi:hypothetical protein
MSIEEKEQLSVREKGVIRMRSIMDMGMGILWMGMGVFFIFIKHFNTDLAARYDDSVMKVFGGVCIIYGIFRIYRSYKKNYLKER